MDTEKWDKKILKPLMDSISKHMQMKHADVSRDEWPQSRQRTSSAKSKTTQTSGSEQSDEPEGTSEREPNDAERSSATKRLRESIEEEGK